MYRMAASAANRHFFITPATTAPYTDPEPELGYPRSEAVMPDLAREDVPQPQISQEWIGALSFFVILRLWFLNLGLTLLVNWVGAKLIQMELAEKATPWSKICLKALYLFPSWAG